MIASVFIAMKARLTWYATMQWVISDDMRAVSGLVIRIDRYAFWLSVIIGLAGWAYIVSLAVFASAAGSQPYSIRTIADSFDASFTYAVQRPALSSFRSSAMEC